MALQTGIGIEEFLAGDYPRDAQLIDGEVVMTDAGFWHQELVARILYALRSWVVSAEHRGRAGVGGNWTVAAGQVYTPDAWWVPETSVPSRSEVRRDPPPALAVEVRSPSTWRYDIGRKKDVYEQTGVAELWLVDVAAGTILVFRRSTAKATTFDVAIEVGPGETLTTPLLDGFALPIDDLFDD